MLVYQRVYHVTPTRNSNNHRVVLNVLDPHLRKNPRGKLTGRKKIPGIKARNLDGHIYKHDHTWLNWPQKIRT